jgi:PhnB protein
MASRTSKKSKAKQAKSTGAVKSAAKSKVSAKSAKKPSRAAPKASPIKSVAKAAGKIASKAATKLAAKMTAKSAKAKTSSKPKASARKPVAAARYHTVTPFLNVRGAESAIDFYKRAFGAEERLRMPNPDGSIMHAELVIGDSTIMLSDATRLPESRAAIHLTVSNCDALFERAVSAGGTERMAPQDMFWGDRYGQVEDPFGNLWSIATHMEDVSADELSRRAADAAAAMAPPPPIDSAADATSEPI